MDQLKFKVGPWVAEKNSDEIDFRIINEKGQDVADVWERSPDAITGNFPTAEEAQFNADLIIKAPELLQGLIDVKSQLLDAGNNPNSVLMTSINELIKPFVIC